MQHASREKYLFSWSVRSMQAERRFTKSFLKLPYMRGEGFCQVTIFCQVAKLLEGCFKRFCQKIKDANSICQTVGDARVRSDFLRHI